MTATSSFRDVIDLWPTKAALARDLKRIGGADKVAPVREWYGRNRIPVVWFDALILAAQHRGFEGITYRILTELFKA